jgi:hypothetical protein
MRFHDAFDRFRGRSCFYPGELFVPMGPVPLRVSRFVASLLLPPPRFRDGWRVMRRTAKTVFFRASVKEGAKSAVRNEFHRWVLELSSLSPVRGFARRGRKKTSCLLLTAASDRVPHFLSENEELTSEVPLRALAPARASCAPLFVGVTNSRFVFRSSFPARKGATTVHHRFLQLNLTHGHAPSCRTSFAHRNPLFRAPPGFSPR